MTEPLAQYIPIRVVGSFAGLWGSVDILDGSIDGDFAQVVRDVRRWGLETDRGGSATRVKRPSRAGSITINLSASSPTNTRLSTLAASDDLLENIVGAIILKDLSGDTVVEADGAFIEDVPDPTFGVDRGSRAWVFKCGSIRVFAGGHNPA